MARLSHALADQGRFRIGPAGRLPGAFILGDDRMFRLGARGEWPLALVVGTIYGAWFVRTKSLGSIMVAHGTTNFLLALYCLFSGDWHFLASASPAPPAK